MSGAAKVGGGIATYLDERVGSNAGAKKNLRKVFPEHWSFMLGEIALYSFIILLLSGTYLTLFFRPSMTRWPTTARTCRCRAFRCPRPTSRR